MQGDTRTVKGMFDTFMQNFAQMSKTMSSVQKELNDLKSDRSRVKSPASSRKRGRDKSGSPPPRKKHLLSKTYEQSDDDSDIDYSDKSDVDEALNTLIEENQGYLMRMKKVRHSINCLNFWWWGQNKWAIKRQFSKDKGENVLIKDLLGKDERNQ